MDKFGIIDILLFSKSYYRKLTDKLPSLYLGIAFIGIVDLIFKFIDNWKEFFLYSTMPVLVYNIALSLTFIVLIGFVDVVFFCIPLYALFIKFKLESDFIDGKSRLVKFIKVYISAHFMLILTELVVNYFIGGLTDYSSQAIILSLFLAAYFIIPVWFCAAITRGTNAIYSFGLKFSSLLFIIIFTWQFIVSFALEMIIKYAFYLFK